MKKACPKTGRICETGCIECRPVGRYGTRNPTRDLVAHNRWARAVKKRDGYRCQARGPHEGPLHAHHIRPGYDLDAGITLCRRHHKAADAHAR